MREQLLIDFFAGRADAPTLAADLVGAYARTSSDVQQLRVEFAVGRYVVTRGAMSMLCDAALEGDLDPRQLEPIGDCLLLSGTFAFDPSDQALLEEIAHCWGAPEISFPLDLASARMFRKWLETGREPG